MYKSTINYQGERATFICADGESILDRLEETLYVAHELTPTKRTWKTDLATNCCAIFDYHGLDHCYVEWTWNDNDEILVTDCYYPC